jgi:hypothetical protein
MTSLTKTDVETQIHNTLFAQEESIRMLDKPLSAYQYYTKHMREQWANLSEEERDTFILQAKHDAERYKNEKAEIKKKSKEEIKKLKIYLCYSGDRVPCVGLDNGFTSYNVIGPVESIELFTVAEIEKLIAKGVPIEYIGPYKSVGGHKFNWKAAKKWGVTVYGGSQDYRPSWGRLRENYEGYVGNFTTYTNYKGETWTEKY